MNIQEKNLIGAARKALEFLSVYPPDDLAAQMEVYTELQRRISEAEKADVPTPNKQACTYQVLGEKVQEIGKLKKQLAAERRKGRCSPKQ
jgi:hypothetical protein